MTEARARVVVVAALKEELSAVAAALPPGAEERVALLQCGVGADCAARTAQAVLARRPAPRLICSTGFCGGLSDGLTAGTIVLAEKFLRGDGAAHEALAGDGALIGMFGGALAGREVRHRRGALVSVGAAVVSPEAKRVLGGRCGALAVDMESFALASSAAAGGTPFLAMRAVSDGPDEALPAEVGTFLDERGKPRLGRIMAFALRRPRNLQALLRLKRRSDEARGALLAAWRAVWPVLLSGDIGD